jgi:Fe-S cluster biosynthesis and repair protein YggX
MAAFPATMTQCLWAENSSDGFENWLNRLTVLANKAVIPRLGSAA